MSTTPTSHDGALTYAIRVQGRIGHRWSAWFEGLDISSAEDGTTTIQGVVADQAALHGLLHKVRDVGLPIVSVTQVATDHTHTTTTEGL
ncbi:hypothetical protein [Actinotalea sp.]|uniref:hypothetical protein n=1 Tax=Actinotalea sp. TaxID=1872145 RepID=UPI003563220A